MSSNEWSLPRISQQIRICGEHHLGDQNPPTRFTIERINRTLETMRSMIVASKNAKREHPKYGRDSFEFLNKKLTAAQKDKFEQWFLQEENVAVDIIRMYHGGYKCAVVWYDDGKVFNAIWTAPKDGETNVGFGLSSKSPNWYRALCIGVYKHTYVTKGNWEELSTAGEDIEEG